MKTNHPLLIVLSTLLFFSCNAQKNSMVTVNQIPGENKVEVKIDGESFSSYIWPANMEKPVLYPLRTAEGIIITRGFPIDPRAGERVDHPHHVGHWLNYGNVNGLDFWNNSYAVPKNKKKHYGSIHHEKINKLKSGKGKGVLEVEATWRNSQGDILLYEQTKFVFSGNKENRTIDRFTTLKAANEPVGFKDNKEGLFAIRMDRAFEFPSDKPEVFTDDEGNPTEVKLNNEGVNGRYLSSEGITGAEVWGTRAKWMSLSAEKEGEKISVVIFDHPDNPGYPTYWHARPYGLFSANPFGQAIFTNGEKEMNFSLDPGEHVVFKYRIYIKSGGFAGKEKLNEIFEVYSQK